MRQTGKSYLVHSLATGAHPARYFTLDDLGVLAAARSDPAGFLAGLEGLLILEDDTGRVVGVKNKAAATIRAEDFKGLRALAELAGDRFHRGVVLYGGTECVPFGPRLHALPVEALWRTSV